LIATEPTFAKAYKMRADYFQEKNDAINAEECTRQYNFYSWVPSFCHYIEYNTENVSILEMLQSKNALVCVETTLTTDTSKRSTEFLASICYHHYHGSVENKAFELLEKRGMECEDSERDFIGSILMCLIRNHRSICTIKGAASALAGLKCNGVFEVLENLLPQDVSLH
jgi:hypothetical protein